ncbi:asparagine synthase (glutamine-hydrolyzing) [Magnetospirillum sp. 64-120]|mgnify:CR=1 FL=1|uniref:asparagine synthase (glutamine-hydrolyzing) n=1 Tax=Magnetospirillum sp. 64-120 TaxID=1895778 RepID=UPI0009284039|nr:asparagine synthase (glutamine-hydrolyzing) [Magnetospirillum sp. 64-120]OJX75913.1 MAG: asparagine synthase (glutamine-hydrolyzing) [Magnetospirillum sp. 64-120]
MCGITGLWQFAGGTAETLEREAQAMTATLAHRGPDAGAVWVDDAAGVALGHRRLSILDLSPSGAQPMLSSDGRFVLVYNGEGYNAQELRSELEGRGLHFRGHSDTEVLAEGFAVWGVEATIRRFNGMFAFAAWDRAERRLWLGRDRLGIKPLYWAMTGQRLLFGSELKALRAATGWTPQVDRDAVSAFLRHNYVPAPFTIYRGVTKLEPGRLLSVGADGNVTKSVYWDGYRMMAAAEPAHLSEAEAIDQLEALLTDSVQRQMVSDVALGAFLSGGVDSSMVVALMRAKTGARVQTFSIGFNEAGFDESAHAAAVARHLGTEHTELRVSPSHALDLVPGLCESWDEPFADSSQIPTRLLAELTKKHVSVALSGDGGDELFAGYNRYFCSMRLKKTIGRVPRPIRNALAAGLRLPSPGMWDNVARLMPKRHRLPQLGDKAHKLAEVLSLDEMASYRRLVSHWPDPDAVVPGGHEPKGLLWDPALERDFPDSVGRMQAADTLTYLPDDILTKVDRATMAVSLEARVPLLDHRLVEFAWTLPLSMKVRDGQGKWILRQVLYRHVPPALIDRPKMGFGVPIGAWLVGPLRDWAEDLLRHTELVDPAPVAKLWSEHLSGTRNWQYPLWDILMLESWRRRWAAS